MPVKPVHVPIPGETPQFVPPSLSGAFGGTTSPVNWVASLPPLPNEPEFTRKSLPGYIGTGISYSQFEGLARGTRTPEIPALTEAMQRLIAAPSQKSGTQYGSWDLSYIDPLASVDSLQSQFEGLTGGANDLSPEGGGDLASFLAERAINSIPQPSRILDYGFSLPAITLRQLLSINSSTGPLSPGSPTGSPVVFPFQSDPAYWNAIGGYSDDQLRDLALREASRYTSQPAVLAQTLYEQFQKDRQYATGLTSGNEHTDYLAKQYLGWVMDLAKHGEGAPGGPFVAPDLAAARAFGTAQMTFDAAMSVIPGIGTPLAEFLAPVSPDVEEAWGRLSADQRQALWGSASVLAAGTELVSFFPFFKGIGAVANLVRAGGVGGAGASFAPMGKALTVVRLDADGTPFVDFVSGVTAGQRVLNVARQAVWSLGRATSTDVVPVITGGKTGSWLYGSYQTALNLMNLAMAEGVAMAVTNWGLEAALPGYSESMGRWVDQSAPFSSSVAGGLIDQVGYLSSATFGVNTLFRITRTGMSDVAGRFHVPSPSGAGENRTWSLFFGGQPMNDLKLKAYRDATGDPLNPDTFRLSAENTIFQRVRNWLVSGYLRRAERIADGVEPTYAKMAPDDRLKAANEYLRTVDDEIDMAATKLNDTISEAHRPLRMREALWMTDEDRLARLAIGKNARELEDTIAQGLSAEYSVTWWQRELATMGRIPDVAGYRAWVGDQAKRLGWQVDLPTLDKALGKSPVKWQQFANGMVSHEYNVLNARLVAALEARPDLGLEAHPNDYVIVRDWHLFRDRADYFLAGVDSLGKEAELVPESELQALKMRYLQTEPEIGGWYARAIAPHGTALEDVTLKQLADHIRDVYPTLPGRHHWWAATPETADLPINQLAKELSEGKQYAIAYRNKDVVAYDPVYTEQANRVSRVAPDGWDARPYSAPGPGNMDVLDDLATREPLDPDYWYVPLWDTLPSDPLALEVNRQSVVPAFDAASYQRMRTTDPYAIVQGHQGGEGPRIIARVAKDSEAGRAVGDISMFGLAGEYDGLVGWTRPRAPQFDANGALIVRKHVQGATSHAPDQWLAADGTWHSPDDWKTAAYDSLTGTNLPNDGMWHATPVRSLLLRDGLRARYDLRVADWNRPDAGGSGLTLRETLAQVVTAHGPRLESVILSDNEGNLWRIHPSNMFVDDAIRYEAFLGSSSGFGYTGTWTPLSGQPDTPIPNMERMGPQNIDELWMRKPRAHSDYLAWKRGEKGPTGKGLFAHDPGNYVSVTYSQDHAEGIADRFRLGGNYVQGKTDITPVVDHFVPIYRKIAQGMWNDTSIDDDLERVAWATPDTVAAGLMIRTLKTKDANLFKGLGDPYADRITMDGVVAALKAQDLPDAGDRFKVFKALDNGLGGPVAMRLTNDRERWVGLLGGPEFLNEINVDDVGVVRVWRNRAFGDPELSASSHIDAERELRFPSTNLWVVDPSVPAAHAGWRPMEPEPWRTNVHFGQDTELVALDSLESVLQFMWPTKALEPANIEALTADLKANGMTEPIVLEFSVPSNGFRLKSGNDRLAAAERLGWKEVPVVVVRRESPFGPGVEYQGLSKPWMPSEAPEVMKGLGKQPLAALGLKGQVMDDYLATGEVPATLPPSALDPGGYRMFAINEKRAPRLDQPWSGMVEDPAYGAQPVYRPVSVVSRKVETPAGTETQLYHAPFLEYPSRASVYLGNRSMFGRLVDSTISGWRTWRMTDYQVAQAHRVVGAAVPAATADQIDNLIARVYRMSYEEWSPFGKKAVGQTPLPPQATVRLRADEVNQLGKALLNVDADYATLLTRAFTQAWTLNFTAALTSRIKTFGRLGHFAILGADWLVPYLRYQASLIFRPSELVESGAFNMLRGVSAGREEVQAAQRMGVATRPGAIAEEVPVEPMAAGILGGHSTRTPPQPSGGLEELGGPFAIEKDVADLIHGKYEGTFTRLWDDAWNPNPVKDKMAYLEGIDVMRKDLPRLIEKSDPGAYRLLHETMKVPDDQIARFLAEDRVLYQQWQDGKIDLATLTEHAAKFEPSLSDKGDELLDLIYATEDWRALEGLFRLGAVTAQTEGFSTHFFGRYRSTLERTVNHPVLGIYPASWAYKAAKEWGKFLYDNRAFGDGALRLGMTPAVAMQQLVHSINVAVAQNSDTGWGEWMTNGPLANWFFMFNLVMPGDWNSIPFPMARTIRTSLRELADGRLPNPVDMLGQFFFGPNNRGGIGIIRDISLATRGVYDVYNAWAQNGNDDQYQNLVKGLSLAGNPEVPPDWTKMVQYPTDPFSLATRTTR